MSAALIVHRAGPGLTVQDLGRPGHLATGLSRGGAMDRRALLEAAALLGAKAPLAGIEMAGFGGSFGVTEPTRLALTGAPMRADIDGRRIAWNASHRLEPGQTLTLGAADRGVYGYLVPAGGIATEVVLDSRAAHLAAGIGAVLGDGDRPAIAPDPAPDSAPMRLEIEDRFAGGTVRVMPGPQTDLFDAGERDRFAATGFRRSRHGNRQGIRLDHDGAPFSTAGGASLLSDLIVPGDIQMTGSGVPFVLMAECQTIGGYPRIGTVCPVDLPRVAQAAPGTALSFRFVDLDEADALYRSETADLVALQGGIRPLVRDVHAIPDLLGYQLIGGVTRGDELDPG